MYASLQRWDDELRMAPVGRGEIDRVKGAGVNGLVELLVGVGGFDLVLLAELLCFRWVTGDDRGEGGVAGVVHARHHVFLGDVACANNGVPHFLL